MAEIQLKVKHQGKVHDVTVNPESNGEELKYQLYSLTNVEPENQKILAGKIVKDDTPLSSLKLKPGATITLIGSPSAQNVVEVPKEKMKFAEDMTEAELAQQEGATPAGLQNTGNTCYANASLQVLRTIPELQDALKTYTAAPAAGAGSSSSLFSPEQLQQHGIGGLGGGSDLTGALRDLYQQMSETQQGFPPIMFLTTLRQKFPQFNERAKNGHGYAQQDAEEMWTNLVTTLRDSLKLNDDGSYKNWVEKYMGGKFEATMTCDDAPDEEAVVNTEDFNTLKCNIQVETNHLKEGLSLALDEKIEKNSPTLNREATYTRKHRISRLPKYLPVHMMRFFWRRDTQKKTKILRKVTFQHEIDLLEFCTEDLRKKLIPVRDKIREVRKEEEDVERAKKRQKRMQKEAQENADSNVRGDEPLQKKKEKEKERELKAKGPDGEGELAAEKKAAGGSQDVEMADGETFKTDEEIDREKAEQILASKKELLSLVSEDMRKDTTAGQTGLYELRGVVTHQGSSADSGHYTAYVKKSASPGKEEDGKWWWFNDDKVQEVESEKIETLAGGGESHSALILLYRAVELPKVEEILTSRKYGVATVWLVATLGSKSNLKKVTRKAILDVDVQKACETIVTPEAPMALRLQSNLLYGVARVYSQQCGYVLTDAEAARNAMRTMLSRLRADKIDDEGHKARADQLVLKDDPNFLPDLDLVPMDIDQLDFETTTMDDSQRSTLSPRRSQQGGSQIYLEDDVGGLVIPQSASSFIGGVVGGIGGYSAHSSAKRGTAGPVLLDDDLGLMVGDDGALLDEASARQATVASSRGDVTSAVDRSQPALSQQQVADRAQALLVQPDDDGFMMLQDDEEAVANEQPSTPQFGRGSQPQRETSEETATAPMQRRNRPLAKTIPLDEVMELHNSDLAQWSKDYVANMAAVLRHKNAAKSAAQAKKNAEFWMLGQSDAGPLSLFQGAKFIEALTGVRLGEGGQKRPRDEGYETDETRRKRSRGEEPSSDEIARGVEDDEGYMPMAGDDTLEQGRDAPTPLDDPRLSSMMPWNQSAGSRRPTALFSGTAGKQPTSASIGPGGLQLSLPSRRGSRLTSASPLQGRGADLPPGGVDDYQLPVSQGDIDMSGADDFELYGPAANVDTQTAAQSQWQRAVLDGESANFLDFVKTGIEETNQARAQAGAVGEADDKQQGCVGFESLLPPDDNTCVVAAQALLHVLSLGTKNLLAVEQDKAFGVITMRPIAAI